MFGPAPAVGPTNRQIARALYLAEGTVANHPRGIRLELGLQSKTRLAAWALAGPARRPAAEPELPPAGAAGAAGVGLDGPTGLAAQPAWRQRTTSAAGTSAQTGRRAGSASSIMRAWPRGTTSGS